MGDQIRVVYLLRPRRIFLFVENFWRDLNLYGVGFSFGPVFVFLFFLTFGKGSPSPSLLVSYTPTSCLFECRLLESRRFVLSLCEQQSGGWNKWQSSIWQFIFPEMIHL